MLGKEGGKDMKKVRENEELLRSIDKSNWVGKI